MLRRSTLREIKSSFGRFAAIMAIIALGVGFFAGVRITTPILIHTVNEYYQAYSFYDLRIMSSIGWEAEDVAAFAAMPGVRAAEGTRSVDAIFETDGAGEETENTGFILRIHTLPEQINMLQLREGRLPEAPGECVLDASVFGSGQYGLSIGSRIILSEDNKASTRDDLEHTSYTVVGFADSALYINFERGTTNIGSGQITGFLYVLPEDLEDDIYSEIMLRLDVDAPIFSDAYEDYMDACKPVFEDLAEEQVQRRYERMYDDTDVMVGFARMANVLLQLDELEQVEDLADPEVYVLGRETNIAYTCFESDSRIVEQIARVFPVFFIMVAALVCVTTMGRMVEEQRGMIGVLKALGYSEMQILGRYLAYAGSAAALGCVLGYGIGVILFPWVIWNAYRMMYSEIPLRYLWNTPLAVVSVVVSLACSMGAAWATCRVELSETAAMLMRPRAPKAGKRVFLEYIPFIWRRLPFLLKVSIRNIFRYKGRLLMMILGISGCTALLLTGFGIRDSISDFADIQYGEIQFMDAEVMFRTGNEGEEAPAAVLEALAQEAEQYLLLHEASWDLVTEDQVKSINLMAPQSYDEIASFMAFHTMSGEALPPPGLHEALISNSIAERYDVKKGDIITLRDEDMREVRLLVSGVFENLVYHYVFIRPETLETQLSDSMQNNAAYVIFPEGADEYAQAAAISDVAEVRNVTVFGQLRVRLSNMMRSLDLVVLVVILCAAGLAFIVLYNLTNINITERLREIATIKVLGFFPKETSRYVFRENTFLTGLGVIVGLLLGIGLHRFVMHEIVVDMVSFRARILPMSFLYSVVLTFVFNAVVDVVMGRKLEAINMAESLKSVE